MLSKPDSCKDCSLYGDGKGFVPDEIIKDAQVTVFLQNPGAEEEREGKPAVGATGDVLNQTLLPQARLQRGVDVSVCNALRCRWNHSNSLPSKSVLDQAIKHCRQYDSNPSALTVAAGAIAWQALKGPSSITDWRGFLAPNSNVLATLHPADLFRNPKMKIPVMKDWSKVKPFLAGTWPAEMPPIILIPPVSALEPLLAQLDQSPTPYIVIDTEYSPETKWLTVVGIGGPNLPVYQIWVSELDPVSRREFKDYLRHLVSTVPVVFQNAFADIPVLEQNLGIKYSDYKRIDDTMLQHAVLWSDFPHTLEFLASLYGKHPKMKHLSLSNPSLYNAGDVCDTVSAYEGLTGEFSRDPLTREVYRSQSLPLVPILLKRMARGIRVNKTRVLPAIAQYEDLIKESTKLARAYCGYPINIGSDDQLKAYLYDMIGYPVQIDKDTKKATTDGDAIAALRTIVGPVPDLEEEEKKGLSISSGKLRVDHGADGVLEARVIYAASRQVLSHYLSPLLDKNGRVADRIYPQFKIHAQASGRWSITDPPLAQLPSDLRDIICPDDGMAWIGWDWDQIELRILAALADDKPYLDAFTRGDDVHTINARAIFQIPQEEVIQKDDTRRVFSKRFVYRLNYGGHPRGAGDIPGAKQLGLVGSRLVDASNRYLAAHPAMAAWRRQITEEVKRTGVVRTFTGRRRRLLGDSRSALREAFNHPMQGSVADILNLTTIAIAKRLPYATIVYTMHDSCVWEVPAVYLTEATEIIKEEVDREWEIQGRCIRFPAKFAPTLITPGC